MSETFKVGQAVRELSGKEKMLVERIEADSRVTCVWQKGGIKLRATFAPDALKTIVPFVGTMKVNGL